ncbi:hypothetical protein N7490_002854 [Penicillium lividum]|nr:hypothetical protein N7490_002854 [Penicillium lividum]
MKFIEMNHIVAFGVILASIATASYFPGGLLSGKFTSVDKRSVPTVDSDGICYTYTVESADTCASIASAFGITVAEIESYNSDTYAWYGCDDIYQGELICLGSGSPTMPVALPHAICGPQVPGTARPTDMSKSHLASLNPCASNECCSTEGQCGTTSAYCSSSKCISNCDAEAARAVTSATFSDLSTASKTSTKSTSSSTSTSSKESKTFTSVITTVQMTTTPWSIAIYSEKNCNADDTGAGYYVLGGTNYENTGECLTLSGGDTTTDSTGSASWCQWYEGDGSEGYVSCGESTLVKPGSYFISSGQCWTFSDSACQDDSGDIYNPSLGCQAYLSTTWNPKVIGSMQCAYV